jgi:hypothetical protein
MEEEQSWHPDGADLPWWAVGSLLLVLVVPTVLAIVLIAGVGR